MEKGTLINAQVLGMLQSRDLKQISVPDQMLPLDLTAARYHIEKAAYLGFAKAQTKMGAACELCQLGCDFDPALSVHYNALASRQGDPDADMAISKWFLCGQKDLFEKSDELAFLYAERAAQGGLPTAEFAMGYFYEIGIHVRSDLSEAKAWYTKAAGHGYAEATGRIEGIARSNTLSKKDHQSIAIARIRSTHGSKRNQRPDRSKASEHMPSIADSVQDVSAYLPRKPYPEDRRLYASPVAGQIPRPVSAAPYPEDRPSPRMNNGGIYPTTNLPVNPYSRPASVATVASAPSNGNLARTPGVPLGPPRSHSSQDSGAGGRGRGMPFYGAGHGPPGGSGYRQPSSGLNNMQTTESATAPSASPRPRKIDVGFSAPMESTGADRKTRLQKTGGRTPGGLGISPKPQPTPVSAGDRNAQRISSLPETQGFTRQSRTASPNRQLNSRPGSSHGHQPAAGAPSLPPKVPVNSPSASTPASSGTSKPPGKGPKTFEEMGVPAQKQKDECVSSSDTSGCFIADYDQDIDVDVLKYHISLWHSDTAHHIG